MTEYKKIAREHELFVVKKKSEEQKKRNQEKLLKENSFDIWCRQFFVEIEFDV